MFRTSAIAHDIAAAAAVAGLARWVRARGPCRPMKLRFDVETERWPGPTVSPLAAAARVMREVENALRERLGARTLKDLIAGT